MNDGNNRRDDRHAIEVWGQYRVKSGVRRDVPIKDLSETGCKFFDKFSSLLPGDTISLKIETLGPYDARVRWQEDGYVGVQFDRPLYGPMFDHIRLRLSR